MPKPYRVILFDCMNTLILPDPARTPMLELDGSSVPSTAGLLHPWLRSLLPGLEPARIHEAARAAWKWAAAQRGPELAEVPARRRFARLLAELGLAAPEPGLAEALLDVHMEAVTGSFVLPEAHRRLLDALRARYRLALFSNFDHAPSLRRLLEASGIAGWFDPLIISEELGYRKPGAMAFRQALALVGAPPEAILFVGDSAEDDVRGGVEAGLDVAWLRGGEKTPEPAPAFVLEHLPALAELLGGD
jgi:FMN phosphatase YigB (HAD superfamily)